MSTRLTILNEMREIAAQQERTLAPLTDDLPLLDTGLDSLCFAILVSRLEDLTRARPVLGQRRCQVSVDSGRTRRLL